MRSRRGADYSMQMFHRPKVASTEKNSGVSMTGGSTLLTKSKIFKKTEIRSFRAEEQLIKEVRTSKMPSPRCSSQQFPKWIGIGCITPSHGSILPHLSHLQLSTERSTARKTVQRDKSEGCKLIKKKKRKPQSHLTLDATQWQAVKLRREESTVKKSRKHITREKSEVSRDKSRLTGREDGHHRSAKINRSHQFPSSGLLGLVTMKLIDREGVSESKPHCHSKSASAKKLKKKATSIGLQVEKLVREVDKTQMRVPEQKSLTYLQFDDSAGIKMKSKGRSTGYLSPRIDEPSVGKKKVARSFLDLGARSGIRVLFLSLTQLAESQVACQLVRSCGADQHHSTRKPQLHEKCSEEERDLPSTSDKKTLANYLPLLMRTFDMPNVQPSLQNVSLQISEPCVNASWGLGCSLHLLKLSHLRQKRYKKSLPKGKESTQPASKTSILKTSSSFHKKAPDPLQILEEEGTSLSSLRALIRHHWPSPSPTPIFSSLSGLRRSQTPPPAPSSNFTNKNLNSPN